MIGWAELGKLWLWIDHIVYIMNLWDSAILRTWLQNIDLIMLIIRVTKANMDSFKKDKAYRGLQQHKIGGVIGSF